MLLEEVYGTVNSIHPEDNGCLFWPMNSWNYGRAKVNGRSQSIPRLVLEWKLGRPIRPGYYALHHCDLPPCVNPEHLYEGTAKDNARDRRRNPEYRKRQLEGIARAKAAGVYKGGKPSIDAVEVKRLAALGRSQTEIAEELEISRMSVWRVLRKVEA
jgi:hypothetical protein